MENLPDRIETVDELDELLSRPGEVLVSFMKDLDGDLMVLGAGGKIGPTISRLARRAVEAAGDTCQIVLVER